MSMTVGVLGGGQLARMLALAGHHLGLQCIAMGPESRPCAADVCETVQAAYDDPDALTALASRVDVVTYEFENAPAKSARALAHRVPVHPQPEALTMAQDRLLEKRLFQSLEIPAPPFAPVETSAELEAAAQTIGLPAMLKTRREGYDGKGQVAIRTAADIPKALDRLGGRPAILESFVAFDREVSILAVRARDGETRFYPLSENVQEAGVLRLATASLDDPMQTPAEEHARRLLERLDYVGVLALEFFQVGATLFANEFAPRVHNSGHWTIEGAETSQFENHLRAVAGLPLGCTAPVGHTAIVNFLGALPPAEAVLATPWTHLHAYGKTPRPGRKVGHAAVRVPATFPDAPARLRESVTALLALACAAETS